MVDNKRRSDFTFRSLVMTPDSADSIAEKIHIMNVRNRRYYILSEQRLACGFAGSFIF